MKKVAVVFVILGLVLMMGVPASAQKPMKVGVNLSIVYPFGDLADMAQLGFGAGATFRYYYKDNIAIKGALGYHMFGEKEETISVTVPFFGTISSTVKTKGTYLPLYVGADYFLAAKGKMTPYVSGLLGYYLGQGDFSDSNLGIAPGAGIIYDLGKYKLDANAVLNYVMSDPAGMYFGINVGLVFDFPKK
jgi:outer membrane protein W